MRGGAGGNGSREGMVGADGASESSGDGQTNGAGGTRGGSVCSRGDESMEGIEGTRGKQVTGAGSDTAVPGTSVNAASNEPDRGAGLGFGDHSWMWGPWFRVCPTPRPAGDALGGKLATACDNPGSCPRAPPPPQALVSDGTSSSGALDPSSVGNPGDGSAQDPAGALVTVELCGISEHRSDGDGWKGQGRLPEGATKEALAGVAGKGEVTPMTEVGRRLRVHRAKVGIGEVVELGEEACYRDWLLRLREIKVTPGLVLEIHVEHVSMDWVGPL